MVSSVTKRRAARLLRANRKTVARKFLFLEQQSNTHHLEQLRKLSDKGHKIESIQFDEMESFERSKCLPLSIPLVVVPGTRNILGIGVAVMPAKGPLAEISRKKYGPRDDQRAEIVRSVFSEIAPALATDVKIVTDQNPKYPSWIKESFPKAKHVAYKGRRGCVVGQGELKKIGFDPLFDLNHTAAMIRANVSRLVRRTWSTTKRPDRLAAHLKIYAYYHNTVLTGSEQS